MWGKKTKKQGEKHSAVFFINEAYRLFNDQYANHVDYDRSDILFTSLYEICPDGYGFTQYEMCQSGLYQEIALYCECAIVKSNFSKEKYYLVGDIYGTARVRAFYQYVNKYRSDKFYQGGLISLYSPERVEDALFCLNLANEISAEKTEWMIKIGKASQL